MKAWTQSSRSLHSAHKSLRPKKRDETTSWLEALSSRRVRSAIKRDEFTILLGRKWFVVVWWLVMVCRGCEIAFLTAMIWLYNWLLNLPDIRIRTLDELRFDMSYTALYVMNWLFACIDFLLVVMLLRTLVFSVRARELTFQGSGTKEGTARPRVHRVPPDRPVSALVESRQTIVRLLVKTWKYVESRWIEPFFYIHGDHFDTMFLMQEYLEVISQVYQGYQMSVYIATRWMNDLFVLMIFLNCISTPIIHRLVPATHVPIQRLVSVIGSTFLNFVNSVILPTILFLPYARDFDVDLWNFPEHLMMDDVYYARVIRENQQLFVTSYLDFLATWMTHFSLLSCLSTCESLIRRCPDHDPTPSKSNSTPVVPISPSSQPTLRVLGPQHTSWTAKSTWTRIRASRSSLERLKSFRHDVLWVVGVLVLGIHIASQSPQEIMGCKLPSTPWFVRKSSCVIMNVNCYRRHIDGTEQQINAILQQIDRESIFQVIFTHCPKLQMPPIIREFTHLGGLDTYNCTIDHWPKEASLHGAFHQELNYLFILRSKLAGIPEGLMDEQFPPKLRTIQLYDTNLTSLPENLHEIWKIARLGIEFGQFERFPSTLAKLPMVYIMFSGNPMTSPDSGLLLNRTLDYFDLSNSSLASLPNDTLGDLELLQELELEYTQLGQVPRYLRDWCLDRVARKETFWHSLYGSPYCNRTFDGQDSHDQEQERQYQRFVCAQDWGTAAGNLKVQFIDPQRVP